MNLFKYLQSDNDTRPSSMHRIHKGHKSDDEILNFICEINVTVMCRWSSHEANFKLIVILRAREDPVIYSRGLQ